MNKEKKVSILRVFLGLSWLLIMGVSIYAAMELGFNWPEIYFGDLVGNAWRSQFNTDFLIHLLLLCAWIYWREESKLKGALLGFLSIFMGGMVGFAYLLHATYKANGDARAFMLGYHAGNRD